MRIFDTHTHAISADTAQYPVNPLGGRRSKWSEKNPPDGDALLAAMTAAGVDRAAVVQASTVYGHDNAYTADCARGHPDKFVGVGSADFRTPDAVVTASYWMRERGLAGLRLFTQGTTMELAPWLDDPATFPAWEWTEEQAIPVCVQAGVVAVPQLENLSRRFPRVIVVLDHICRMRFSGRPVLEDLAPVLPLAEYPNIYLKVTTNNLDTAQASPEGPPGLLRLLVDRFGADRMVWGSNYPAYHGSFGSRVELLTNALAGLDDKDAEAIAFRTAEGLYG